MNSRLVVVGIVVAIAVFVFVLNYDNNDSDVGFSHAGLPLSRLLIQPHNPTDNHVAMKLENFGLLTRDIIAQTQNATELIDLLLIQLSSLKIDQVQAYLIAIRTLLEQQQLTPSPIPCTCPPPPIPPCRSQSPCPTPPPTPTTKVHKKEN
eukprot:c5381_g1_i1.p1 GENE.c5381_g1_i1~~c5381_g1_i1.p1  ORF type:complete len:150 (+),score=50.30 c5381_g1_i1:317-766(+)